MTKMAIEITKTKVSKSEISSEIDLDLPPKLSQSAGNKVKDEAGELIIGTILLRVGKAKSPIQGESWPGLDPEYKKLKKREGRGTKANLEFSGDMLDALTFKRTDKGIKLAIGGAQAPKADGHNNFSGRSKLPRRKFLPEEGDKFVSNLNRELNQIVSEAVVSARKLKSRDLRNITTKSALNAFLKDEFEGLTVREAKSAILVDEDLRDLFDDILDLF